MRREPLGDRLERRKPAPNLAHVPSHTLRVPVLDRCEDPAPPVVHREDPPAVGAPHHVRRLRDDRPGMHPRGALAAAVRGEQLVRPQHPQHPRPRDPDPVQDPQPRVDRPMALALERRAVEIGLNRLQQRRVRHRGRRTPPRGLLARCAAAARVSAGRRAPSASAPTPDTRAGSRRGAPWPRRAWRSSPRPPHRSPAAPSAGGAAPPPVPAHAAARSPSTAPRCAASPRRASPPRGRPGGPARRAQDRPRPGPASPPAGRSRRPLPATAPPAIRRAAAAAPRPASGPRSSAAPAPGAPPHLPRRRRARPRSPSGLPPSPPTPSPARSSIEPFPPPPWTLDSPLISVQENWGRFRKCPRNRIKPTAPHANATRGPRGPHSASAGRALPRASPGNPSGLWRRALRPPAGCRRRPCRSAAG